MKINNLTPIIFATGIILSSGVQAQNKSLQLGDIINNNKNLVHSTLCANTVLCNTSSTIPIITYDSIDRLSILGNRVQQISDYELLRSARAPVNSILARWGVTLNDLGQVGPKDSNWSFRMRFNHDRLNVNGFNLNATYRF